MADSSSNKTDKSGEVHMQANTIDQANVNHQANMTLSAHSVITQSHYIVRIADAFTGEEADGHE